MDVYYALENIASSALRRLVLDEGIRVDGRGVSDLRRLYCESRPLQAVHGSGLFERGGTQSLCTAVVGVDRSPQSLKQAQITAKQDRRLLLHYRWVSVHR